MERQETLAQRTRQVRGKSTDKYSSKRTENNTTGKRKRGECAFITDQVAELNTDINPIAGPYTDVVNSLVCDNTELMTKFEEGRLRHYVHNWREITSDKHILQTVTGYKIIEFSEPPYQYRPPTAT